MKCLRKCGVKLLSRNKWRISLCHLPKDWSWTCKVYKLDDHKRKVRFTEFFL
ncbi:hypothetical protein HanXRQr2_Chr10g0428291 [Helianthus annuus]|uniref:Uncharacterized protein n=1 Tax=Helianthus annuus TaxID=4232 RepID=A0A9K3N310_HELAN|nr:hypothetical protein HanXRQr2_Chr10g0428291 [Helianthus annuus]